MPSGKNSISIILPTYNESGNILRLIDSILRETGGLNPEIIIVDDNSPDGTGRLVSTKYRKTQNVKTVIRKKRGLASAIFAGIKLARGNSIAVMDTDFNHDPCVLPKMFMTAGTTDLVTGSRYIKGGGMENKTRYYFSKAYNKAIQYFMGLETTDYLSGFFCINAAKLRKLPLKEIFRGYGDYFIRLVFYAKQNGLSIAEIPVFYKNRDWGASKSKFLQMFLSYSKSVFEVLKKRGRTA